MSEKNTVINLKITDLNPDGNGIGRTDTNRVVFVPLTAPGDECEVKIIKECTGYLIARLERIISPSPNRIEPECPVYNRCGGCSYGHVTYEQEKKLKEDIVRNAFLRIAGMEVKINPLVSVNNEFYRNKVQYPVATENNSLIFGYYARHSHKVIPHNGCMLQDSVFYNISKKLTEIFEAKGFSTYNEESGKGLVRHIYLRKTRSGDVCVCIVINADMLPDARIISDSICTEFPQIKSFFVNINKMKTNVILGEKNVLISGSPFITDVLCGKRFTLSPSSFFQVNSDAAEKLYEKAAGYASLGEGDVVLDLYCGTGTIGLCIAGESNQLCGVEIIKEAVDNAKQNAIINGRSEKNTLFICGDAEKGISECKKRFGKPNVIIVDPPRKGLTPELIDDIVNSNPDRVVYISCNPATLARDIKIFSDKGYKTSEATPFDLFPRTGHVESCVLLERRKD
ncbi:MAG: 23S rRNA (uracil-5-)-methyltransferase RumA [Clostridiales bacterium GWF2_36_10]|nr:MAG: 23S rRNA (uracil-5-)-methyltransferase RumA [Clostridiales bacterium GWF2_36_10]HAN22148.1 23S rRNA (uracil(1939)-C(5))-methyltransferase RlmD [Clostridiales bacterium]